MKFKTAYLYIAAIILAVVVLFVFTRKDNPPQETVTSGQLPNDDVHKGIQDGSPSTGNVNPDIIQKMNDLKAAADQNPNDTAKVREYADFLALAHKQDEAIPLYEKILKKDPKRKDILFTLAFIYYNKQDISKAEELTNKVLAIDKNNLQALYNLGALAATKGDKEKARELWNKIIKEHPGTEVSQLAENSLKQLQ